MIGAGSAISCVRYSNMQKVNAVAGAETFCFHVVSFIFVNMISQEQCDESWVQTFT